MLRHSLNFTTGFIWNIHAFYEKGTNLITKKLMCCLISKWQTFMHNWDACIWSRLLWSKYTSGQNMQMAQIYKCQKSHSNQSRHRLHFNDRIRPSIISGLNDPLASPLYLHVNFAMFEPKLHPSTIFIGVLEICCWKA